MAGLVPAIHALPYSQGVDARHKAGHDVERAVQISQCAAIFANRAATLSRCTVSPAR